MINFSIQVQEIDNYIKISGFSLLQFKNDLLDHWGTNKILNLYEMIFAWYSSRTGYLQFHKFFLPEMIYILKQLPKRKIYQELIKKLYENTWIIKTTQQFKSIIDINKLKNLKRSLVPWQIEFLEMYDQRKQQYNLDGYLNASEMGTSKTSGAIALMYCLNKDKVIVVAPNNTIYSTWVSEISIMLGDSVWTKENPVNNAKWYIVNYEAMDKIIELIKKGEFKNCNVGFIIDEVHHFRNKETNRSQNAFIIKQLIGIKDVIALSGTPIKALGSEMIPLMKLIDPFFTEDIEKIFIKTFGKASLQLSDIIAHRLGLVMFRKTKEEVIKLPIKTEETINIKIPDGKEYTLPVLEKKIKEYVKERTKYYKENKYIYEKDYYEGLEYFEKSNKYDKEGYEDYKKMVKKIMNKSYLSWEEKNYLIKQANIYEKTVIEPLLPSELKKRFHKAKSVVKYVELVIMGEVIGFKLTQWRKEVYCKLIQYGPTLDIIKNAIKKSIIFTTYGDVVEISCEYLSKNKCNPVAIYQKTSRNINSIINNFKNNESINPLVTTIQMMSTGVTLTEANTVIFAPQAFRFVDTDQAAARVHRLGQTDPCFIYTFVLDTDNVPNISTRINDISDWSKELFLSIMGENIDKENIGDIVEGNESFNKLPYDEKEEWLSGFEVFN